SAVQDSLYIYDPELDAWREGTALPEPRAFLAGVVHKDEIYALGGRDATRERAEVWRYERGEGRWTSAPALPAAGDALLALAEGTSLYVLGGGRDDRPHLHERFDTLTGSWSTIDTPRQGPWRGAAGGVIGPTLHVVGGWSGEYLSIHEAYQAGFRTFLPLGARGAD
ncbi:MAG: hypothetical protein D6775_15765, partial [Caldilineae bacterium]